MAQLTKLNDPAAVREAMKEFQSLGRGAFLSKYDMGSARQYVLMEDGRFYDAKAIVAAAYGIEHPDEGPLHSDDFSGGFSGANPALERLGFVVHDIRKFSKDEELAWRLQAWQQLQLHMSDGTVPPDLLRQLSVYGGAQGIWVDKVRTGSLAPSGVAVSVLHTGRHYADDLADESLIYHFPSTRRPPARDAAEVEALAAAGALQLPIFVITEAPPSGSRRRVQVGWVADRDDVNRAFLIQLTTAANSPPPSLASTEDVPFHGIGPRPRSRRAVERALRDPKFKFFVAKRYAGRCAVTGIGVTSMLEAAHVIPVEYGGTDDPRNGILLAAHLHRALDSSLWAIHPETFTLVTRDGGPSLLDMGLLSSTLYTQNSLPHTDALAWRYEHFSASALSLAN